MNPTDTPEAASMMCLLCMVHDGIVSPPVLLGAFRPSSEEARTAVLILRRRPAVPGHDPGLAYGLCSTHSDTPAQEIENTIIAASRGTIQ